jgi:methylated-DNA-protein-cysteine methyltransferase-like protein
MKKFKRNPSEPPSLPIESNKSKGIVRDGNFFEAVYRIVRMIPKGRVSSYGAIAEFAGTRLSARMVGWAMNAAGAANPPVPAHRVVNRNGMLTGKHHFPTPSAMEDMLRAEGIEVIEDRIVRFRELFWNPSDELNKK